MTRQSEAYRMFKKGINSYLISRALRITEAEACALIREERERLINKEKRERALQAKKHLGSILTDLNKIRKEYA